MVRINTYNEHDLILSEGCTSIDVWYYVAHTKITGWEKNQTVDHDLFTMTQNENLFGIFIDLCEQILSKSLLKELLYIIYNGDTILHSISSPLLTEKILNLIDDKDEYCTIYSSAYGISLLFTVNNIEKAKVIINSVKDRHRLCSLVDKYGDPAVRVPIADHIEHVEYVKLLLDNIKDKNKFLTTLDVNGQSLLYNTNNFRLVQLILDNVVDKNALCTVFNTQLNTVLHLFCTSYGLYIGEADIETVKIILNCIDDIDTFCNRINLYGKTVFHYLCEKISIKQFDYVHPAYNKNKLYRMSKMSNGDVIFEVIYVCDLLYYLLNLVTDINICLQIRNEQGQTPIREHDDAVETIFSLDYSLCKNI